MVEALNQNLLEYTGTVQPNAGERDANGQLLYAYLPSKELIEVVNLAIYLERPLLLKGEPGCGKTQLARAVAYELGLDFEAWYVKSTSRARDGLYTYDAVGRLRDAQMAASSRLSSDELGRIGNPISYVRLGPLGRAFQNRNRTVVLIDEIDKADIDFPNDLLVELDERQFVIDEVRTNGKELKVQAKTAPIVFITSNDEKDLPDAFLRRCLFHYVQFPSHEQLVRIVYNRFLQAPEPLVERAVARFLELREEMRREKGDAAKNVSTSELLDWFRVLQRYSKDEVLVKLDGKLPFLGVLLKSWDDHLRYLKRS
jgi:MoxR-like ATPase